MWIGSNVRPAAHWEGENDTDNGHPCHPLTTRVGAWHQRVAVERSTEVSPQPAPTPRNACTNPKEPDFQRPQRKSGGTPDPLWCRSSAGCDQRDAAGYLNPQALRHS